MKKLLILTLLSFNTNAAELVPNHEFNDVVPGTLGGLFIPVCWQTKTTGTTDTYTTTYPTYDNTGTFYAFRMASLSQYQLWLAQRDECRIPVTAGSTYRYTIRAKCNGVMNAKIEHYKNATLLKHEILAAPTIGDQAWHTIVKDFVIPTGTNKISIGPHTDDVEWCNVGMVSLQKL